MPNLSDQQLVIKDLEKLIIYFVAFGDLQELKILASAYEITLNTCYLIRGRSYQPRDDYFFLTKFVSYSDSHFRSVFKTTRETFAIITALIEHDPIFTNNSNLSQTHPGWQLAVALTRFGHYGNRISFEDVACDFGIAQGTVVLFTNRVVTALINLAHEWITWPDEECREEINHVMQAEGFPGCVRFIDRTTIPVYQKPALQGSAYYDWKNR
ncbi:hypothetical protein BGZ76_011688 [Entomortierella beljakovae]|nr:hypothetical protein BGZ76_011688 [Entomortierella beljakovae]